MDKGSLESIKEKKHIHAVLPLVRFGAALLTGCILLSFMPILGIIRCSLYSTLYKPFKKALL